VGEWINGFAFIHNVILIILSFVMGVGIVQGAYERSSQRGIYSLFCGEVSGRELLRGKLGFWMYVYYVSKYYELIDTVILLLKGKEVIMLHVYHHAVMIITAWSWVYYGWLEGSWWCVFVNSIIHFFMYIYYALSIFHIDVWWKKYLTSGQIVQFMTGFVYVSIYFYFYFGNPFVTYEDGQFFFNYTQGCFGYIGCAIWSHIVNGSFIILFIQFFMKTYNNKSNNKGSIKKQQ